MKHFVYKTTNLINGKYYIGVHSTNNIDDGYLGSGDLITAAIKKHGVDHFTREIIEFFNTAEDAYTRESELVTQELINDPMCYNIKLGGIGGCPKRFTDEEIRERRKDSRSRTNIKNKEKRLKYAREYSKQYYDEHKDDIKQKRRSYNKEYYERTRDNRLAYMREYAKRKTQNQL